MDRKLLQYLVECLVEEGKAHGCALPPAAADAATAPKIKNAFFIIR